MDLTRIVSGGQTGVDRAGLDAAMEAGIPVGGWCPAGRLAEDGRIPDRYPLRDLDSPGYAARTERNVVDSDATLVLNIGELADGTALTAEFAREFGKPLLVVQLDVSPDPAQVASWIEENGVRVLNVAGPRESKRPGVYRMALRFMRCLLGTVRGETQSRLIEDRRRGKETSVNGLFRTSEDLLSVSNGYWAACALHAAVKLDLFTPLSACPHTVADLAGLTDCDNRGLSTLLKALAAMGLAERAEEGWSTSPFATEYLSRTSPRYLGHILLHHHFLMPSWAHLDEAVREGVPMRERYAHGDEAVRIESFELGMFDLAMRNGPRIAQSIDLSGRVRLLDLGGGPGTYAIHFCMHNPGLSAVVFDLPSTRPFAEQTIARFGLSDRISFVAGDYLSDAIPDRYDAAWLSHILHAEGPGGCSVILAKAASALAPGGLLLVQEFILDDTGTAPLYPALFSLNMLLGTREGRSYSEGDLGEMLEAAGLRDIQRLPLDLPNGAGVMAGRVP